MYNILISVAAALLVFLVVKLGFSLPWWVSLLIALPVFMGLFFVIARIVTKKLEVIMGQAMKDIQSQRFEKGIRDLKGALKYGNWQIYVTGQINSSIGMVYYVKRDFSNAFPFLEKGFFKNWVTMGMLAICYMKRSKRDKMRDTFEKAVMGTPRESLLWSLYAYCLNECSDAGKAREVLEKGLKKLPGDDRLQQNLVSLSEGKKMKMKNYGEMWLQFHLESLGTIQKQQLAAMGGKRRIIRK